MKNNYEGCLEIKCKNSQSRTLSGDKREWWKGRHIRLRTGAIRHESSNLSSRIDICFIWISVAAIRIYFFLH